MKTKTWITGHILALITIIIWGNTFVSTRFLIIEQGMTPLEILFYRFLLAYVMLLIIHPRFKKPADWKEELLFLLAGFLGVTFYQLMENLSLSFTSSSNVSLIGSTAPIFTAVGIFFFDKSEKLTRMFFIGVAVAILGTVLIIFNGQFMPELNPLGDFLALSSAVIWGAYSVVLKRVIGKGYHVFYYTRKMFFYALLAMIPFMILMPFRAEPAWLENSAVIFNIAFLGVGASAIGFVTWNKAVAILGAIRTSPYIYLSPLITIVTAAIVLNEPVTPLILGGCALILIGVYISDKK